MIEVKDATKQDLDAIMELFSKGVLEGNIVDRPKSEIAKLIKEKKVIFASDGQNVAGMVILDFYSKRFSELRSIYVEKDYRSKSVGKMLVEAVFSKAKKLGVKELMIVTVKEKEGWFRKFGFNEEVHGFKVALFKQL